MVRPDVNFGVVGTGRPWLPHEGGTLGHCAPDAHVTNGRGGSTPPPANVANKQRGHTRRL